MTEQQLVDKINELEFKAKVYCDIWGPGSAEVVLISDEIKQLKMQLIDLMIAVY